VETAEMDVGGVGLAVGDDCAADADDAVDRGIVHFHLQSARMDSQMVKI
jgi:hypothetical protein